MSENGAATKPTTREEFMTAARRIGLWVEPIGSRRVNIWLNPKDDEPATLVIFENHGILWGDRFEHGAPNTFDANRMALLVKATLA